MEMSTEKKPQNDTASDYPPPLHSIRTTYDIPLELTGVFILLYATVFFCAVVGNGMVLWIIIRANMKKIVTNLFIANIAIGDIISGALVIPTQFQAILLEKWVLPHFMCPLYPSIQITMLNVTIFTLIAVSIDRHRAVTQPLKSRISQTTGIIVILFIWMFSIVTAVPAYYAHQIDYKPDDFSNEDAMVAVCAPHRIEQTSLALYKYCLTGIQYLIPMIIIVATSSHMVIVLSRGPEIQNESIQDSIRLSHRKKRAIKMIFLVMGIFALCWLPYQLYIVLVEIFPSINYYRYINIIWICCHLLGICNSCCNPFIYAIYGEQFNQQFHQRFHSLCFWLPYHPTNQGVIRLDFIHHRISCIDVNEVIENRTSHTRSL